MERGIKLDSKEENVYEYLASFEDEGLFNLLRKSHNLPDDKFKALIRECVLRLFYGDGDFAVFRQY